jgi:hypothetical protein
VLRDGVNGNVQSMITRCPTDTLTPNYERK